MSNFLYNFVVQFSPPRCSRRTPCFFAPRLLPCCCFRCSTRHGTTLMTPDGLAPALERFVAAVPLSLRVLDAGGRIVEVSPGLLGSLAIVANN